MMNHRDTVPVSAVIPCFRCAGTIRRAVTSIAQQTVKPAEVILIDDASGDSTWPVLQKLAQEYPGWIRVEQLRDNQGAANARNAGWALATQPYVAFLDSDDAWHPRKIELQYAYMAAHPEVALSGHLHRVLNQPDKLPDWRVDQWQAQALSRATMLMSNHLVTPSVMLKRDVPQRFLSGRRHVDDHLLWLELLCAGHQLVKLSAELVAVYKHLYGASGLSSQLWLMEKSELDNYLRLYRGGSINFAEWLSLSSYSLLKYVRRLLIFGLYLKWKK